MATEPGANGAIDTAALDYATAPAATLFLSHEQWLTYVESVLNERQLPAFRAVRDSRSERKRRYLAGTLANGMSQQFGLSAKQTTELFQLVLVHFPNRDASLLLRFELFEAIAALPLGKVSTVIGEENMADWKQQLASVEKLLDAREASNAKEN